MSAGVRLYDLANARDILDEFLAETEGEVTPELAQLLDELEGKADEKIERVALYVREQLATATAIEEEAKRLNVRAAARARAADGLKKYLQTQMERLGKTKVEGLLATVALQKNGPAVVGEVDAFEMYVGGWGSFVKHVPESFALDRRAVLAAHKAGEAIPPGLAVTQSTSLRIR